MTDSRLKIIFIGDIVGKPGRRAVQKLLPDLIARHGVSLVVANGENAAGGFGINRDTADELLGSRIDVITSGNHLWDKREIIDYITGCPVLLRPANFPPGTPGKGSIVMETPTGLTVGFLNLIGRVFMLPVDCPFRSANEEITRLKERTNTIIVDIHAEATSEKKALAWYLSGRASAVIGTHTHVQTADEEILTGGTAYITDAGMTGPHDSIIGIRKDMIIERFLNQMPARFEVARANVRLQGVLLDFDAKTGKALAITRLDIPADE